MSDTSCLPVLYPTTKHATLLHVIFTRSLPSAWFMRCTSAHSWTPLALRRKKREKSLSRTVSFRGNCPPDFTTPQSKLVSPIGRDSLENCFVNAEIFRYSC